MTITMWDSITISEIPANAEAVAGYTSGHWPTYPELVKRFPHAHVLSIAVQASQRARCLDCEPGDASVAQAPQWFRTLADRTQGPPVLYTSASSVGQLIAAMAGAGIKRSEYLIWSAHYTFKEHICAPGTCGYLPADATQWTDKALGRNLDQSICSDHFFPGAASAPGPTPPTEDEIMAIAVAELQGVPHVFVEDSKGAVWYTWQKKGATSWEGGQAGKHIAGLKPFAAAPK